MQKVVIAGSASLEAEVLKWKDHWEQNGFLVLDYPRPIHPDSFLSEYPSVFKNFFDHIADSDVFFVMNESKNEVQGYVGAETFAELAYAVYLKMKSGNSPKITLLQKADAKVRGSEKIELWEKLGLITYLE
jgi:hypothetical protein